ncbi:hypothetical protein [Paraglaciecola sp. 25GB23A]|uniref:hypothetical protein n=1 Tax=Paraglaciecola sp. 25GB23A TaxID=3156068 RepID=UPI0032AFAFDB
MASLKPLKGAAYNIAHHAQSGLSCLYPYVGELCQKAGLTAVTIRLLDEEPYPTELDYIKPFSLAVNALVVKFEEILSKLNLPISEVAQMDLTILLNKENGDGSVYSVESKMVLKSGVKWVQVVE